MQPPCLLRNLAAGALALSCLSPISASCAGQAAEDPERITRQVRQFLQTQLAQAPGKVTVSVDPVSAGNLAACDRLQAFLPASLRLRSRMSVGVRCIAPQAWTVYAQATVSVAGQYYVAARRIAPGQIIQASDLRAHPANLATLPPGVITDPANAVGLRSAHRIAAGQTLKAGSLRNPRAIQRGQNVRLVANGPGFTVSSEGQALNNAAPGARVQVRTASGQVVSGVLQDSGEVRVTL